MKAKSPVCRQVLREDFSGRWAGCERERTSSGDRAGRGLSCEATW